MAKDLPLSEGELRLLRSLVRHRVRFMIVGLSAAALQGAPVVTEDIDLWFEDLTNPNLSRALRKVGAAYVPPFGLNPPMLAGQHTDPFDVVIRMDGLEEFAREIRSALKVTIGGLRLSVLPLDRIIVSKTAAHRAKDRLVLPVLKNALRTTQSRAGSAKEKNSSSSQKRRR